MSTLTYGQQLKHPNWQRRRLEKLEASHFICDVCCDGESTLHVHHKRYVKGRLAWEYTDDELAVLCEGCHAEEHVAISERDELLSLLPCDGPAGWRDLMSFGCGAISEFALRFCSPRAAEIVLSFAERHPRGFWNGAAADRLLGVLLDEQGAIRFNMALGGGKDWQPFRDALSDLLKQYGIVRPSAPDGADE